MTAALDPAGLTAGQLAALRTVANYRLRRVPGGWQAPGSPKVREATVSTLVCRGLAMRRWTNGVQRMEITATGGQLLDLAAQRRKRA